MNPTRDLRKIIHIDLDAFYASVEQRDHPELRGRPVIVGGDPRKRGVVATCSYEARKYGIHSAMPSSKAARLCPNACFVPPRFDAYREASSTMMEIFHEYTDLVEPLSLDEAFLDVTANRMGIASATQTARLIRSEIFKRTSLTASAGVSFNKFLAKAASDFRKPNGLTVITPERALEFIDRLPIGKFFGVGRVTKEKMRSMGITTGAELRRCSKQDLTANFGKSGAFFHSIANAIDPRPVQPFHIRKSLGREVTLEQDIDDIEQMESILSALSSDVEKMLQKKHLKGRTITLKIKYFDFRSVTRSISLDYLTNDALDIMKQASYLIRQTEAGMLKVRLLGLTISNFDLPIKDPKRPEQLILPIF